jgi:cell division protein FtsL
VTLLDLLSAPDAATVNSWFVMLLLAGLLLCAFTTVWVFGRTRKPRRRAAHVRARAEQERLASAATEALHLDERDLRPPTQLERVERILRDDAARGDDFDGPTTEWWPFTDRRQP